MLIYFLAVRMIMTTLVIFVLLPGKNLSQRYTMNIMGKIILKI